MSANTDQPRQPRGVPAGGQWRATARPESRVTLVEPADEREDWETREAAVAERIRSYHPDCARRWASDSLLEARQARGRAVSTVLAEAVSRLPQSFKQSRPQVPWRAIATTRNRVVHDYENVDFEVIRDTFAIDLPELRRHLPQLGSPGL